MGNKGRHGKCLIAMIDIYPFGTSVGIECILLNDCRRLFRKSNLVFHAVRGAEMKRARP